PGGDSRVELERPRELAPGGRVPSRVDQLDDEHRDVDHDQPLAHRGRAGDRAEEARPFVAVVVAVVDAHDRPLERVPFGAYRFLISYHNPGRRGKAAPTRRLPKSRKTSEVSPARRYHPFTTPARRAGPHRRGPAWRPALPVPP